MKRFFKSYVVIEDKLSNRLIIFRLVEGLNNVKMIMPLIWLGFKENCYQGK